MIFDTFCFFRELDVLEWRLNILNDVVDKFVLVESNITHSGQEKDSVYLQNKERFKKFNKKIIHSVFDGRALADKSPWSLENNQRNHIKDVLVKQNIQDSDVVLISDCDEIPHPEIVGLYRSKLPEGIDVFRQKLYYYYINLQFKEDGNDYEFLFNTRAAQFSKVKELEFDAFRRFPHYSQGVTIHHPGGWHLSFMGSVEDIQKKIEAFSHQEFNQDRYTNKANITYAMKKGKDVFGRMFKWEKVPLNSEIAEYFIHNQNVLQQFIKQ